MGLVDLMSSETVSRSGRPLQAAAMDGSSGQAAGDNDAYISQIITKDQARQEKQEASEMRRLGVELREMWLAKVRQQEYDKKEERLNTIDKRLRSETSVRVREREYRKARAAAMFAESKARVAQQEQDEKARFEARQARSMVRTQSAEHQRVALVKQRSAELATKKVLQAETRERAAALYRERLQSFVENKAAKEKSAQRRLRQVEMERKVKFQVHREVEAKQQAYAAEHRRVTDEIVRAHANEAYNRNIQQERARAAREEELEIARQRWRYKNRRKVKERRDSIERFRRTGKLDTSLSANLGGDALANDIRASMLTPATRAAIESLVSKHTGATDRKSESVTQAVGSFKRKGGLAAKGDAAKPAVAKEAWAPLSTSPRQLSPTSQRRPQSAGATQSTGVPQWRPPRPRSAAPASNSIAARVGETPATRTRRPQSADSYSMRQHGTLRPRVSMLA